MRAFYIDRDGERHETEHGGARWLEVPRSDKSTVAGAWKFRALPAEVLRDRFNPKYDKHFPYVQVTRDVYEIQGREDGLWRYEFSHERTFEVQDRYCRG